MANITLLGIDIAKNTFALCGLDSNAKVQYRRTTTRKNFANVVSQLHPDVVVMEACGGANHWARLLIKQGITVKLISPQLVKPFVKTNKNDARDAEAIAIAGIQGHMRFVSHKTFEQQDIQSMLRARNMVMTNQTQRINEIRGLLLEYGVAIPKGKAQFFKRIAEIVEDPDGLLTPIIKRVINQSYATLLSLTEEEAFYDKEIGQLFNVCEPAKRLEKIPGVGKLSAMAVIALAGDVSTFQNGRHFSAYLGLVPRQHSSGGVDKMLGMSKRGNAYVRSLLIHGARAVLRQADKSECKKYQWLRSIRDRRGHNRACVALANKHARIIWAMLSGESQFKPELAWH